MGPLLIGREASRIEDIWQCVYNSGYWRSGSILNAALGGIDMALWDIKGKEAGMPVYELLGGACRAAVPCYAHAGGGDHEALADDIQRYIDEGWPVIRCQLGGYGGGGFVENAIKPRNAWSAAPAFDDEAYLEAIPAMFEYLRNKLGFGPKLTHDVHEHLKPKSRWHWPSGWNRIGCFSSKTRWRQSRSAGTGSCASNAPRRRPWASYSSMSTNTCR